MLGSISALSALCAVLSLSSKVHGIAILNPNPIPVPEPAPAPEPLPAPAPGPAGPDPAAPGDIPVPIGQSYKLTKNIQGDQFYDEFDFFDKPDPTGGLVEYQSLDDARKLNLTEVVDGNHFVLRGDSTETVPVGRGRKSTRIESKDSYDNHVHIIDIAHMPTGKGTWPAYWLVGPNWPSGGELDIVEGANDLGNNLITLHTTHGCTMDGMVNRVQSGKTRSQDCDALANGNIGCSVFGSTGNDFGPRLNNNNGGFYAYQKTDTEIKVWFWKRYSSGIPADILDSKRTAVNPDAWGPPTAHFASSDTCTLKSKIQPMKIIMNLTFCGGFAGHMFVPGFIPACEDYVRNNPQAFADAYWKVYGLRIFE